MNYESNALCWLKILEDRAQNKDMTKVCLKYC